MRCKDGGVKQALVIGGSAQPVGDFHCSLQLLETGLFEGFRIGIAGHPDGSPDISDSDLEKAMKDKKPYADYIVTQWLMEPDPIIKFVSKQSIPVHVGITGPMKVSGLLKFANTVGAKNSINFIKSTFRPRFLFTPITPWSTTESRSSNENATSTDPSADEMRVCTTLPGSASALLAGFRTKVCDERRRPAGSDRDNLTNLNQSGW